MTFRRFNRQGFAGLVTTAILAGTLVLGNTWTTRTAPATSPQPPKTIEGTWWVNVSQINCQSGAVIANFVSLLTFAQGGTMTGTSGSPVFAAGQRSPDHGTWSQAGGAHEYTVSSIALIVFATSPNPPVSPGFEAGSQTLSQSLQLTDADHFTSDAVIRFFRTDGIQYRQGCATATGERFE